MFLSSEVAGTRDGKTFAAKGYERTVEGEGNVAVVVAQIYVCQISKKISYTQKLLCVTYTSIK